MAVSRGGYEGTLEAKASGDDGERGAALAGPEGSTHALGLQPILLRRTPTRSWLHWAASSSNLKQFRALERRVAAARGVEGSLRPLTFGRSLDDLQ
jgi:hypothetical protein